MITFRDVLFIACGAAIAAAALSLAGGRGMAGGFIVGALATASVCVGLLRSQARELDAAARANRDLLHDLLAAWSEADRLRGALGQAPLVRDRKEQR